ncbi:Ribonuclease H2 subunit B [Triticum urartu]|uniref:Ribonuclease H2 subunit B n=1 Tax=Triticum urartu TaxID=4572 RepID=M7ZU37_TRIUA|nr:Ribonuclease H2 subunit B [Triticum urartu]
MALPPRVLVAPQEETQYLFTDGQLHEFNWFKERYGSWFLGDYVCEDGSVYYCTLVDPIFVLLPLFEAARMSNGKDLGKFRQLDEILYIEGYPGYQHLMSIAGKHMELVCEVKEVANMKFFRLDDSKVLTWMCCKCREGIRWGTAILCDEDVREQLLRRPNPHSVNVRVFASATSTQVHSIKEAISKLGKNYAAQGERELLKEAVQIIRENLKDEPWLMVLCKKLQLDISEINDMAKTNDTSFCADSSPVPAPARPSEGGVGNSSAKSSKGRPAKKLKPEPARVAGQSPCGGGGEVLIGGGLIVEVEGCCEMMGFVCLSGNLSEIMFHGGIGDPT